MQRKDYYIILSTTITCIVAVAFLNSHYSQEKTKNVSTATSKTQVFDIKNGRIRPKSGDCGKSFVGQGTCIGGEKIKQNSWPWIVILESEVKKVFFCGGSLISLKHVLTGKKSLITECT